MSNTRLKTRFGFPCRKLGGERTALWYGDKVTILSRIGSHYLCFVDYGSMVYGHQMLVWLHKRKVNKRNP